MTGICLAAVEWWARSSGLDYFLLGWFFWGVVIFGCRESQSFWREIRVPLKSLVFKSISSEHNYLQDEYRHYGNFINIFFQLRQPSRPVMGGQRKATK